MFTHECLSFYSSVYMENAFATSTQVGLGTECGWGAGTIPPPTLQDSVKGRGAIRFCSSPASHHEMFTDQ